MPREISKKNNFCVLLTATIDPKDCAFTLRNDPEIREKDYLDSLSLWLSKTLLPIVFCENSGYDLSKVRFLSEQYPGRVEIIQFNGNNYPKHLRKGQGELEIIEKALSESKFIKKVENIVKVTGRIYIDNIKQITDSVKEGDFVRFKKQIRHGQLYTAQTIIFIFKASFFDYINKYSKILDDSKGIFFEKIFAYAVKDAKLDGHKCRGMKSPRYVGYAAERNMEYKNIFITAQDVIIHPIKTIKGFLPALLGVVGEFLKKYFPKLYKMLKPYFPDKKVKLSGKKTIY